jgi:predicted nucleic acid-binding protein
VIVVDTSVWVAALRDASSSEARHLRELLEEVIVALPAPVKVELLSGASATQRRKLLYSFAALPVLYPSRETWDRIDGWVETASRKGERFGAMDLLIASLAADHGGAVWSLDADFERLGKLGLVPIHRAAAETST